MKKKKKISCSVGDATGRKLKSHAMKKKLKFQAKF
jgi:hypothetical protein